jgi:DNA replication protein DnaC
MRERMEDREQPCDLEEVTRSSWHAYAPAVRQLFTDGVLPNRAGSLIHDVYFDEQGKPAAALKQTPAIDALRTWFRRTETEGDVLSSGSAIAVLAGPPGTGKTVAVVWMIVHRLAVEEPVFVTAHALARTLHTEQRDPLFEAGALVIDDLGAEPSDARYLANVDELIDVRYRGYGTTIITTNLTSAQFKARYGLRVMDRLAEVGTWLPATGKSMRGRDRR